MRAPIAWLREYVDLPAEPAEIAERLAMLGFPVEAIEQRPALSGILSGKIVSVEKHPNADRLLVTTVDVGSGTTLTIVTAATNVAPGQVIPVATIGARLPKLTIEPRTMRGIESQGMLCSPDELGLPPEWFEDGIMQLDDDMAPGRDVVEYFHLSDPVLEVEVTSNRVDAASIIGLARELAASYALELRLPSFENPGKKRDPAGSQPSVSIESPDCRRFVAQRFTDIQVTPAPAWMRIRLALAGQRPINNLVDISNYVMLETAQPLHFYDDREIAQRHIVVRDAHAGETLKTLDGEDRKLEPWALVIADARRPLGLAGLMGGAASEVRPDTTAIILESANFSGPRVRRMSTAVGLRTEASSRHEKMLSPALTDVGAARAAALLMHAGATGYAPHAFGSPVKPSAPIALRAHDVERLLGFARTPSEIANDLKAIGCDVSVSGQTLEVTPPPWRRDLTIAADLVEEVARVAGYDRVPSDMPPVFPQAISSAVYDFEKRAAHAMAALGYFEIVSPALHGAQLYEQIARAGGEPSRTPVEVRNPLSEDQRYLRYALGPGLIEYLARVDVPMRAFEIGHVFSKNGDTIVESAALSFGFAAEPSESDTDWHDTGFLRLKGDAEALLGELTGRTFEALAAERPGLHPGKTAVLRCDGVDVASIGRVDPRIAKTFGARLPVYLCNIEIEKLPPPIVSQYHPPSKFPSTYRDLALVVALETSAADVERTVRSALGKLCVDVRVFDEYRGQQVPAGRKSLAVRAVLQRSDATITDDEADTAMLNAVEALKSQIGAVVRA